MCLLGATTIFMSGCSNCLLKYDIALYECKEHIKFERDELKQKQKFNECLESRRFTNGSKSCDKK